MPTETEQTSTESFGLSDLDNLLGGWTPTNQNTGTADPSKITQAEEGDWTTQQSTTPVVSESHTTEDIAKLERYNNLDLGAKDENGNYIIDVNWKKKLSDLEKWVKTFPNSTPEKVKETQGKTQDLIKVLKLLRGNEV